MKNESLGKKSPSKFTDSFETTSKTYEFCVY